MPPESVNADLTSLPRSLRGYDPQATEDLFRRLAWEYDLLLGEHRKLKKDLEERQPAAAPHKDHDAVTRSLITAAHNTVREMRESARAECEAALKKAKKRAANMEEEASRASADAITVIKAAALLRANLQATLRSVQRDDPVSTTDTAEGNSVSPTVAPLGLIRR